MCMYTYKVMIHPNNKQETKIRRTLNKCIECNHIVYDYLDNMKVLEKMYNRRLKGYKIAGYEIIE